MRQLHFLFEEPSRRGREGFVVFCSVCECVLRVSKGYSDAGTVVESLNMCPSCGAALERSVAERSMPVSEGWASLEPPSYTPRQRRSFFQPADSLRGFRSGLARLDCMVEPLEPGRLAVFRGRQAGALAELLSFRAQLPASVGGLDSGVVFIDGGNSSDLYLFSRLAMGAGVSPKRALRRVTTSRAFTVYQLAELVSRELPRAVEDHGARLAVVSDALSMFADPSITQVEARRVVSAMCDALGRARRPDTLVVVTLGGASAHDAQLDALADILLELSPEGNSVRASLLKHPRRRPASTCLPAGVLGLQESMAVWRHGKNGTFVQDGTGR